MNRSTNKSSDTDELSSKYEQRDPLLSDFDGENIDLGRKQSLFGNENPYQKAGLISRLLFNWVTPLVSYGFKEKLTLEDLSVLPDAYHTSLQEEKVNKYWKKYQHKKSGYPLIWAICMAYKNEFLFSFFLNFLSTMPDLASPFIIQRFLQFIENEDESIWVGISLAATYVVSVFIGKIIMEQGSFYQMQLGSKCSAGVTSLIYSKSMRISSATNKQFQQGEIVNFIQIDSKKIILFATKLPSLAKLPIVLVYCIIM
jgi:ABC-type bacteriocin/lantibiotic exporter with double-glycine peptidase domain